MRLILSSMSSSARARILEQSTIHFGSFLKEAWTLHS